MRARARRARSPARRVVAITNIAVTSGEMSPEIATPMVGAAVLSVLFFPAAAQALLSRHTPTT
jgi:hypothetical protein